MIIAKQFYFDAAHKLPNDECYGQCSDLHGHTYKLIVEISGEVNSLGWVINFTQLKEIVNEKVVKKYDHKYLNDFFKIPTAENIIQGIKNDLGNELERYGCKLHSLKLYETEGSYVYLKCE